MTKGFGKSDERRIDTTVSKRLRMYRIARNLTQTDLGNALNVTFQEIQKYEKGTNSMASGRLRLACDALRVTPNDLFGVHVNGGAPCLSCQCGPASVRGPKRLGSRRHPRRNAADFPLPPNDQSVRGESNPHVLSHPRFTAGCHDTTIGL